jgi:hypothetical protein
MKKALNLTGAASLRFIETINGEDYEVSADLSKDALTIFKDGEDVTSQLSEFIDPLKLTAGEAFTFAASFYYDQRRR